MKTITISNLPTRLMLAIVVIIFICGLLVYRGMNLTLLENDFLQNQGDKRSLRKLIIPASRGMITDRNGHPLAISTPMISVWSDPSVTLDEWGQSQLSIKKIEQLSKLLELSTKDIKKKLKNQIEKEFVYLKRHIKPSLESDIAALDIPGIHTITEYKRFYPASEVASHIVGLTNIDDVGQEGIELAYDQLLKGQTGELRVLKDLKGRVIKELEQVKAAKPGEPLVLSLDLKLQYLVYKELQEAIAKYKAQSATSIILDSQTGDILALVNAPSFNPNNRKNWRPEQLRNRALTDQFEPGSTIKPITIAAALESGKYNRQSKINTGPGYIQVADKTIKDPINRGIIDIETVLAKSSQVGITKISLSLKEEQLRNVFYRFGLGQSTAIGYPGEAVGFVPNSRRWSTLDKATLSFGYGVSVTPIQLAQSYMIFANLGIKKPLNLVLSEKINPSQRVLDQSIAKSIMGMLKSVVGPDGTAAKAAIDGYSVAGKTGTVRKVGNQGYDDQRHLTFFVGITPVENPRLVGVVLVNEPQVEKTGGGEVAAPIFSKIMEQALSILNIPPSNIDFLTKKTQLAVNR